MKKLIKYFGLIMMLLFPGVILAAGSISVSTTYMDLQVGTSGTINLCANNSAGRIDIYSNNGGVVSVNKSSEFLDTNCVAVGVYGASIGTTTVVFNVVDATTYDGEDLTGRNIVVTINVYQPSTPQGGGGGGQGGYTPGPAKDGNTGLSSLSIEGYTVTHEGNKYLAEVPNDVEKIVINATPASSTSVVSGTGEKTLTVGINEFSVNVKAENGASQTYFVIVTRKSEYITLSELDEALGKDKNTFSVKLADGDILSLDLLNKIKSSKKIVNLYYFDEEGKVKYTWVLDSSKINPSEDFNPIINLNVKNKDVIQEEINFVEAVIIEFKSPAPEGAKLRLNTSGKYTKNDKVIIYSYKDKIITKIGDNSTGGKPFSADNTDFIEFTPTSEVIYILSKGNLVKTEEFHSFNPIIGDDEHISFFVPALIEFICIIGLITYICILHHNKSTKKFITVTDSVKASEPVKPTNQVISSKEQPAVDEKKESVKVKQENVSSKTNSKNKQNTVNNNGSTNVQKSTEEPNKKIEPLTIKDMEQRLEPLDTNKVSNEDLVSTNPEKVVIEAPKVDTDTNKVENKKN